ncbi:MAG: response regulator transcription factor [Pseudonocardia sp.]|nr:response regulator transcription factor [Pseudonocardia sp.]
MTLLDQRPVRTLRPPPAPRRIARVLVIDGEAIVRFGLRQLFAADPELVVVGEAAGPRDALALAERCPPDLVVLDVDLGREGAGLDVARRLLERHRGVRILVLTGSRDRDLMMRAMRLGVHGFLRKTADTAEVVAAVRALRRGEGVFDAGPVVVDMLRPDEPRGPVLTERETQVLKLLAVGMSNREIGERLLISEATVKFHVRNLRDKLEVRRRTEIVHTATRQGIV